jgi:hypothetical protein
MLIDAAVVRPIASASSGAYAALPSSDRFVVAVDDLTLAVHETAGGTRTLLAPDADAKSSRLGRIQALAGADPEHVFAYFDAGVLALLVLEDASWRIERVWEGLARTTLSRLHVCALPLSSGRSGALLMLDLRLLICAGDEPEVLTTGVFAMAVSPDFTHVAVATNEGCDVFDIRSGARTHTLRLPNAEFLHFVDSGLLAIADMNEVHFFALEVEELTAGIDDPWWLEDGGVTAFASVGENTYIVSFGVAFVALLQGRNVLRLGRLHRAVPKRARLVSAVVVEGTVIAQWEEGERLGLISFRVTDLHALDFATTDRGVAHWLMRRHANATDPAIREAVLAMAKRFEMNAASLRVRWDMDVASVNLADPVARHSAFSSAAIKGVFLGSVVREALRSKDEKLRWLAVDHYGRVAGAASDFAEDLQPLLADKSPPVAARAAWALGAIGDAKVVDWLRPLLTDKRHPVAAAAAGALAVVDPTGSAEVIAAAIARRPADISAYLSRIIDEVPADLERPIPGETLADFVEWASGQADIVIRHAELTGGRLVGRLKAQISAERTFEITANGPQKRPALLRNAAEQLARITGAALVVSDEKLLILGPAEAADHWKDWLSEGNTPKRYETAPGGPV